MQRQKAVIYARYSSSAQRDTSIDQQIKACTAYADRQDLEIVGIYDDRAMTGTNDHRPQFQKMIADAAHGDWDYVLVYALDRFARDRYDSAVNKKKLKDAGVRVLSVTESISDDPSGILMESLLEGMAEYYSAELSAKVQRGLLDNANKCRSNGPMPPGYIKSPDGRYQIYEPEAAAIQELFDRVRTGESIRSILDDYNQRGLRTRKGKPWSRNVFYNALSRELYTGVYIYRNVRIEGGVPQIIDRETFDAVQLLIGSKTNPRKAVNVPKRRRREKGVYLLTGKLFCGACKSPMVGVSGHSRHGTPYYYYVCKKHRTDHTCSMAPVRRDQIEYAIADALVKYVLTENTIPSLADTYLDALTKSSCSVELEGIEANLSETRKSIKNIMSAIEAGIFTPTVQTRLQELEAEEKLLNTQATEIRRRLAFLPSRDDLILTLMMFKDGDLNDPDQRAAVLDTFLVAAYIYHDEIKLIFKVGDGNTDEISVPFDFDPDDNLDESVCSYNGTDGPPIQLIRTL